MHCKTSLTAIVLAMALPSTAMATHSIVPGFAPLSEAYANGNGAAILIRNGVVDPAYTQTGGAISASASPDGWTNTATASNFGNNATGTASLSQGTLRASAATGNVAFTQVAIHDSRFRDTLFFTNSTNAVQSVTFTLSLDGSINGVPQVFNSFVGGFASLNLQAENTLDPIRMNNGLAPGIAANMLFAPNGIYSFNNLGNTITPEMLTGSSFDPATGTMAGFISVELFVPTGLSSLGVGARLALDCRQTSVCNFGNTGRFAISELPDGLSYTSASGVFLSETGAPGGVPEPATWAMLIFGFGITGIAARRRRAAPVVVTG